MQNKVLDFFKQHVKKPGLGFVFAALALVFAIVATALFAATDSVSGTRSNRWAVMCCVLAIWILAFLLVNMLFQGDKPFWTNALFVVVPFLMLFAFLLFIKPHVFTLGFVFGAGDLNMGNVALRQLTAQYAMSAAVFFVLSVICSVVTAFMPAGLLFGAKAKEA